MREARGLAPSLMSVWARVRAITARRYRATKSLMRTVPTADWASRISSSDFSSSSATFVFKSKFSLAILFSLRLILFHACLSCSFSFPSKSEYPSSHLVNSSGGELVSIEGSNSCTNLLLFFALFATISGDLATSFLFFWYEDSMNSMSSLSRFWCP